MKQEENPKPPVQIHTLRIMGGCCLFYPAARLARRAYDGSAENWRMNVIGAALLGAGGFFLIWRTWREYRRVQARHNAENRDAGPEEDI